ncbi:MAG: hypothetical protein AMXMBFR33_33800 [Candidatus Xenobia bacterium]
MATSGSPINPAVGNQQALVKRTEHVGQTAVTGTTRKTDGTSVEQRNDEVTLSHQERHAEHLENATHLGLTGQAGAKQTRQGEESQSRELVRRENTPRAESGSQAEVLDPEQLGKQLVELVSVAPDGFKSAFANEGKALMGQGLPGGAAAGQAAINVASAQLNQLEGDISTNVPPQLAKNPAFGDALNQAFEADRAAGKQTPAIDIFRQAASKEVAAQLASDPGNAELKAYGDKLSQYGLMEQIANTGRGLVYSLGGTPAGTNLVTLAGNGGGPVAPGGNQLVGQQSGLALQGPPAQQLLGSTNAPGLLSSPVAEAPGNGGGATPPGGGSGLPPGGGGGVPPGGSAFVPGGSGIPPGGTGVPPGGSGIPPGGGGVPPGGSGIPPSGPGGPGGPGGPTMSAADQARRMQQILQDQEGARDIWMQIWAERQKHEAERWKIMKETMDYWMKTFQESTVNQAMTMQRVNEMWHQYFRS